MAKALILVRKPGIIVSDQIRVWSFPSLCRRDRAFVSPIAKLDPLYGPSFSSPHHNAGTPCEQRSGEPTLTASLPA